jgi:hypothetical protein
MKTAIRNTVVEGFHRSEGTILNTWHNCGIIYVDHKNYISKRLLFVKHLRAQPLVHVCLWA